MLSVSSVIPRKEYSVHSAHSSELDLPILYDGETMRITLQIRG
jgi:hypothetical protein